jgi:hypothetical protein
VTSMWSGPGRALQFHLDLFERVEKMHEWLLATSGQPIHTAALPTQLLQRLRLMTASAGPTDDGDSISVRRDSESRIFTQDNMDRTTNLILSERHALDVGETHYVSHHVAQSIVAASQAMDPEVLHHTDLPCPAGLIVFEYPIVHDDLHPETGELIPGLHMPIRAIAWTETSVTRSDGSGAVLPGISYMLYCDAQAYADIYVPAYARLVDDHDADMDTALDQAQVLRTWLTDSSGWAYGVEWEDNVYGPAVSYMRRWLLAYFRWTWQRILVPTPHTPSRSERKLNARIRRPPLEDGHIKVLRLRREIEHERKWGTEYQGVYDRQFMVRGHWRRQHYKSLGPAKVEGEFNPASHRLVWVEPFIKGNPNGPLILGHNVTSSTR